jgi:hypothetical protein
MRRSIVLSPSALVRVPCFELRVAELIQVARLSKINKNILNCTLKFSFFCLTCKYYTWLKRPTADNVAYFPGIGVTSEKKFYNVDVRS